MNPLIPPPFLNRFLTILIFIFFFANSSLLLSSQTAINLMQDAMKQRFNGNLIAAISNLRKSIEIASKPVQKNLAFIMLGDCLIEARRHREAIAVYKELLSSPNVGEEEKSEAYFRVAQCHKIFKDTRSMARICNKLIEEFPKSPYAELARVLLSSESAQSQVVPSKTNFSEKKEIYIQPVPAVSKAESSENPPVPPAPTNQKPFEDQLLNRLLTIDEPTTSVRENLAAGILKLQDYHKRNPTDPKSDQLLFQLASKTARFGEHFEACRIYDTLLSKYPSSKYVEKAYFEAIRLRAILGIFPAVISWSEVFQKTFPGSTYIDSLKHLRNYAEQAKNSSLETTPQKKPPYKNTEKKPQSRSQNKNSGSKFQSQNNISSNSQFILARRYVATGKYELAVNGFSALCRQYPNEPQIWWELALVQVQQKRFQNAETSLRQLLILDPENSEANSLLGYIHYQRKDYNKAGSFYRKAGSTSEEGLAFFDPEYAAKKMQKSQKGANR